MSKHQTRRSVSVRGDTYQKLMAHREVAGKSVSEMVEEAVAQYFASESFLPSQKVVVETWSNTPPFVPRDRRGKALVREPGEDEDDAPRRLAENVIPSPRKPLPKRPTPPKPPVAPAAMSGTPGRPAGEVVKVKPQDPKVPGRGGFVAL